MSNAVVDKYLWNEASELVEVVCPEAYAEHADEVDWFEVRQGADQMEARGAVVTNFGKHSFLAVPRNRDMSEYLTFITDEELT